MGADLDSVGGVGREIFRNKLFRKFRKNYKKKQNIATRTKRYTCTPKNGTNLLNSDILCIHKE